MDATTSPRRAVARSTEGGLRVVVCPDTFKGTVAARDASRALREGWLSTRPQDSVEVLPMADGGEGTLDAMESAVPGARRHAIRVEGPTGQLRDATWLELPDGTAVVELAETSGIGLLDELAPLDAHTIGVGQALRAALDHGARRILVAIGGSASTDGGAGLLTALGARLLDADGAPIAPGVRGLAALARVDLSGLPALPPDGVQVLSDVRSPLTGAAGAAAVFGPQKGLTAEDIPAVDGHLARLGALLGIDTTTPGTGAAGGAGAGLLAWGATLTAGAPEIARSTGLDTAMGTADVVITGEGKYDAQTAEGKVVGLVGDLAARSGARLAIVAGLLDAAVPDGALGATLTDIAGSPVRAMSDPLPALHEAGRCLAQQVTAQEQPIQELDPR